MPMNIADIESRFVLLDIGAANQRFSEALNSIKSKYIISFEPDERSVDSQACSGSGLVYPYALAGKEEFRTFYLTRKPECSSLYKPNRAYVDLLPDSARWDIVKQERVFCKTLNSFSDEISDIDFINIDVQGAEYEILQAGNLILEKCLGLEVEVEFIEIYKNQPLFGDVLSLLAVNGFEFYEFVTEYRYGRKELNRKGQLAFADALFLRTPEYVFDMYRKKLWNVAKVNKYKKLVCAYGKDDLSDAFDEYIRDL